MKTLNKIIKYFELNKKLKVIRIGRSRSDMFPKMFNMLEFKKGAVIGVGKGHFSKLLSVYCPSIKIKSVDAWKVEKGSNLSTTQEELDNVYASAKSRLTPLANNEIVRDWSADAAKQFENESLDFVYIDAAKDYKGASEDISIWAKKVKKGGLIMGNNYIDYREMNNDSFNEDNYMVKQAVDHWVEKYDIKPLFVTANDDIPSWFYVK
jgi:hypothetical protein